MRKAITKQLEFHLIGWGGKLFLWRDWKLNGGDQYYCWRLGPFMLIRYLRPR